MEPSYARSSSWYEPKIALALAIGLRDGATACAEEAKTNAAANSVAMHFMMSPEAGLASDD
jgi:hypothetical protein